MTDGGNPASPGTLNQGWVYRETVPAAATGQTLLDYYTQRYRHSSRTLWQHRIETGQVCLEGQPVTPDTRLCPGQSLAYHRPPWHEPDVPLTFAVCYEDADLLVIEKPAGLPVLPGGGFLTHTLLYQLQQRFPQETPVPIHRLGRGTSGLMLLARSPLARADLSQQMRRATQTTSPGLRKTYRALIGSSTLPDRFILTTPIGKIPHPRLGYIYGATSTGKPAHSEGQILRREGDRTLVEVTIRTGRPHQIRIHLAAAGYPLLGDPLYIVGGIPQAAIAPEENIPVPGDCGYHLHALRLGFIHPRTREPLCFECPPPRSLT